MRGNSTNQMATSKFPKSHFVFLMHPVGVMSQTENIGFGWLALCLETHSIIQFV